MAKAKAEKNKKFNDKVGIFNLANIISFGRLVLLPFIVWALYSDNFNISHYVATALIAVCFITDFLDGYIARKYNLVTNLGRIIDPILDKISVFVVFIVLAQTKFQTSWETVLICLMMFREFSVSAVREFMEKIGKTVHVSQLAKLKTTLQMFCIGGLVLGTPYSPAVINKSVSTFYTIHYYLYIAGQGLLIIATILTLITGWQYVKGSWKYIAK